MKNSSRLLSAIVFLILVCAHLPKAQAQCRVTYLPINTGLNLSYFSASALGSASTPSLDQRWKVVSATSSITGAAAAGSPAYIIAPVGGWATNPATNPGRWISCLNASSYTTDGAGTAYNMTLGRPFNMCIADSITISLNIANDNYISRIDIDGTIVLGFSQAAGTTSTYYSGYTTFTQTIYLSAGSHVMNVLSHNYNLSTAGDNPTGINIYGRFLSATNTPSLVYEPDSTCPTYPCAPATCNSISLLDTVRICIDSTTRLVASVAGPDSITRVRWFPGVGLSDSTVLNPIVTGTTSRSYRVTVTSVIPGNLIPNGAFTQGYNAFTSGHTYSAGSTSPGYFGLGTNPRSFNGAWAAIGDHTTGSGPMLIVDGITSGGASSYCITVPVSPNTFYDFSSWFVNLYVTAPPSLNIFINGTSIGTSNPTAVGVWTNFSNTWFSGSASYAVICIYNTNLASFGNDFAIDDISMTQRCVVSDSVYVSINPNPRVNLGNDTAICVGNSITLQSSVGYTAPTYLWSTGATTASIIPTTSGIYSLTVTENGCVGRDTMNFIYKPNPRVNLGNDTGVCSGTIIRANILPGFGISYLWSTGATTFFIPIPTTGNYWLRVDSNGCRSTDSINVAVYPDFAVQLGNDTSYCQSDSVVLQSRVVYTSAASYLWSTGATTPTITIATSGRYWLRVTQGVCSRTDTINILFTSDYGVHLGNDTTYCRPGSVTLSSSEIYGAGTTYLWSDGATTATNAVPSSGTYWLRVFVNGCVRMDTINIRIVYDSLFLYNNDTAICKGDVVQVFANNVAVGATYTYQWLPTAGIALSRTLLPIIRPDTTATYVLVVSTADCPSVQDSFHIDVQPKPSVYLGNSRHICQFDTMHVRANVSPEWYAHYSYLWSPGTFLDDSTTQSVVYTAGDSVLLKVAVSTPIGCVGYDSIYIHKHAGNFAGVSQDTAICPHDIVTLRATGLVGSRYNWTPSTYLDDSTLASPIAKPIADISYRMIATSSFGCRDTQSVNITVHPGAVIFMEDTVVMYTGEQYQLNTSGNCVTFNWFPVVGLSNAAVPNPVLTPEISTLYYVDGLSSEGCKVRDSVHVVFDEKGVFTVPNAFSPGKGVNNTFKLHKRGIASLNYFRIYNRWGNVVFETKDVNEGWDGSYQGAPQPLGVYVYEVKAVSQSGRVFVKSGNVTLLR